MREVGNGAPDEGSPTVSDAAAASIETKETVESVPGAVSNDSPSAPADADEIKGSSSTIGFGQVVGCLYLLLVFYGALAYLAYTMSRTSPVVPMNATTTPADQFSEERAMRHVVMLAESIGNRQEGTPGLIQAGNYLLEELSKLQEKAGSRLRFEVDHSQVSGSFNINFLHKSMTMVYQNLTNIAVRISDPRKDANATSVLVNAHYDSGLYSPGASDCAACVACSLEGLRQIIDSDYLPPTPFVFLFNGGEEIFLKAAHGFVTTHPWAPQVGAFINFESSGSNLPDFVIQAGPGSWVSRVYSQSAIQPVGSVLAQDVFPFVPGDTDYRILAQNFDNIPGLDFAYFLGSHTYHTFLDTPQNLQPGAMQTRGGNLLPVLHGLATAPELKSRAQRALDQLEGKKEEGNPVYFDLWGKVMVHYPRPVALAAHLGLFGLLALVPYLTSTEASGVSSVSKRYDDLVTGLFFYFLGWVLAIVLPVTLAILRVAASKRYMNWIGQPYSVLPMFVPAALAGFIIPQMLRRGGGYSRSVKTLSDQEERQLEWSNHWGGVVGHNAFVAALMTVAGAGTAYIPFWWALFMLPALWLTRRLQKLFGRDSPLTVGGYLLPGLIPSAYAIFCSATLLRFVVDTMNRSGTHPLPYGVYVPDVAVAVVVAFLTGFAVAPIVPACAKWLNHPHVIRVLCYTSILSAIYVCRLFPYNPWTPKRLVIHQVFLSEGESTLLKSEYNIVTGDANDAQFFLQHAPQLAQELGLNFKESSTPAIRHGDPDSTFAFYPISELLDRTVSTPAPPFHTGESGFVFPHIKLLSETSEQGPGRQADKRRRVELEVNFGSLKNVWGAVLNLTGPITSWSFLDGQLPNPEISSSGRPFHIVHYGGANSSPLNFWVDLMEGGLIRIKMGVIDHRISPGLEKLGALTPNWTVYGSSSSYISHFKF